MSTQFEELIAKHLKGVLQEEEKQLLAIMLKAPENQLYLASKIDEQFFDQSLEEAGNDEIGKQIFQDIRQRLKEETLQHQAIQHPANVIEIAWYKRKIVRSVAVAASIILVIGLGIVFFVDKKPGDQTIAVQNNDKHPDSAVSFVRHEVNTTGKEKSISLQDGSLILLADKSEIAYREPFTDKRDITLIGKAYFKVAKDKTRPFTVISGDISTTALGTEFDITAFKDQKLITVKLYEGRVVVKPVNKANKKFKNDVYLLPGEEFVYDTKTFKVRKFKFNKSTTPRAEKNEDLSSENPSIPQNIQGSWFMFNNQSLGQVLDQLEALYNVKIVYRKQDIQHIYFTGKFNKSDSVELILNQIAKLNNLTVTRKDSSFIISK